MNIYGRFARTSSFLSSVVVAVVLFGQHNDSMAGVIPATVVTDTALKLDVTWYGKGLLNDGTNNDSLAVPTLTNWSVGPNPITLTYLGGGDGWFGKLTVEHITAPHAGEGVGGTAQFFLVFDQLSPTSTSTTKSVAHGTHTDVYTLTYTYIPATDTFTAELKGAHVPEPTSFALLGVGAVGLIGARLRRKSN